MGPQDEQHMGIAAEEFQRISACDVGEEPQIGEFTEIGACTIGDQARVRSGTVIYDDVRIGDDFETGHHVLIREQTVIGDDVLVGTGVVIDGHTSIGSQVRIQTGAYVPTATTIGDRVFIGPHAVLTNDRYPLRETAELAGPMIADDVSIGANSTILPGVTVGQGAFVAAGAVVTKDVPEQTLAVGTPARTEALPPQLQGSNRT